MEFDALKVEVPPHLSFTTSDDSSSLHSSARFPHEGSVPPTGGGTGGEEGGDPLSPPPQGIRVGGD